MPDLEDIRYMGYSVRSVRYRYTMWVGFDHENIEADWNNVVAEELYDHNADPGEIYNK